MRSHKLQIVDHRTGDLSNEPSGRAKGWKVLFLFPSTLASLSPREWKGNL
jgi:hypothetical protein